MPRLSSRWNVVAILPVRMKLGAISYRVRKLLYIVMMWCVILIMLRLGRVRFVLRCVCRSPLKLLTVCVQRFMKQLRVGRLGLRVRLPSVIARVVPYGLFETEFASSLTRCLRLLGMVVHRVLILVRDSLLICLSVVISMRLCAGKRQNSACLSMFVCWVMLVIMSAWRFDL